MGFRDRNRGDHVTGNGRGEIIAAQFIAAKTGQGRGGHIGLYTNGQGDAAAMYATHFFAHHQAVGIIQTHAAKLGGLGDTQQPQVAHFLEYFVDRKTARRFPFFHVGIEFLVHKVTDGTAKFFVFLSENHWKRPVVWLGLPSASLSVVVYEFMG